MKALQQHEVRDPTRQHSRAFMFKLPNGETACMELCIIPKSKDILDPQTPHRPTNNQVIQTLNAASRTHIQTFTSH